MNENIETVAGLQQTLQRGLGRHQRVVERLIRQLGRPRMVYSLLTCAVLWMALNAVSSALGRSAVDPAPFFWLQGTVALYAAVVTTMVLTAQNRQSLEAEQRAQLELQVSLLAEQKATKIIALLEELRRDLPIVRDRRDPLAEAMQEQVDPKAVLTALESTMENAMDAIEDSAPEREARVRRSEDG